MAENASTIIGGSILVNGNLEGDEDLTVLGRVLGSVNLTKTLMVAESGVLKADISVRNAIISGVVVGNVTASDSVELTEAGRVVGDIKAPRVIIVEGARFRGNVDMGNLDAPRASGPMPARTVDRESLTRPAVRSAAPSKVSPRPAPTPTPTRKVAPPPPPPAKKKAAAPVAAKKKLKKRVVVKKKKG